MIFLERGLKLAPLTVVDGKAQQINLKRRENATKFDKEICKEKHVMMKQNLRVVETILISVNLC